MHNKNGILEVKSQNKKISGILRRCEKNPRYFSDSTGKPLYLTGSHTWSNMQEYLGPNPDREFDYKAYLDWMEFHGFNFMRGWVWEQASFDNVNREKLYIHPLPYVRTGPGIALDGEPRFDLNTFNEEYFNRLRRRIIEAGERGIYVSIMLFNKFSTNTFDRVTGANPWNGHPFNKDNNINGIDGDPAGLGGRLIHTLSIPEVLRYQEKYVKKVIDTVNDLENVLYEIGNEHYEDSVEWQYHMVRFIQNYEKGKPIQHPVGITSGGGVADAITNRQLFDSPADWISPRDEVGMPYKENPIPADGSKVIIIDTDHLWGLGGNIDWVWKSFTRGLNPILMDPYEPLYGLENSGITEWVLVNERNHPIWEPIRKNMGYARYYAERVNLADMIPREDLSSSEYCLADYGREYLIYIPNQKEIIVDLGENVGDYSVEFLDPYSGICKYDKVKSAKKRKFINPYDNAAVLYIAKEG